MKNTLENKAKFFAQYFGQEILYWYQWKPSVNPIINNFTIPNGYSKGWYLELKPLSSITNEDAKKLGFFDTENFIEHHKEFNLSAFNTDRLRTLGYALDWNGITVKQQVEFGWIKLEK